MPETLNCFLAGVTCGLLLALVIMVIMWREQ